MLQYILYALLAWFLYNLIFRFIIPVYKTTRQVRKQFRQMQEQFQQQHGQQPGTQPGAQHSQQHTSQQTAPQRDHDYIEFEEVK